MKDAAIEVEVEVEFELKAEVTADVDAGPAVTLVMLTFSLSILVPS
jgi:hypothetical protein